MAKNYYESLGIDKKATEAEIKKAYKKQAMQYHPDKNAGSAEASEMFKKINNANEALSNPAKRSLYEQSH